MNLRDEIGAYISRAVDSTVNYSGLEYDLNRHNWVQITTDRVLAAVMQSLPPPVDIKAKFETDKERGIFVHIDEDEKKNKLQIDHLAAFSEDQGYNKYYFEYTDLLRDLYTIQQNVIQSDHDKDDRIHGQGESDSPQDKEPSKVR